MLVECHETVVVDGLVWCFVIEPIVFVVCRIVCVRGFGSGRGFDLNGEDVSIGRAAP